MGESEVIIHLDKSLPIPKKTKQAHIRRQVRVIPTINKVYIRLTNPLHRLLQITKLLQVQMVMCQHHRHINLFLRPFPSPRLGYSPMTPGHSSSPYSPLTQAGGNNSASIRGAVDWYTPDIEVTIASTYEDSALHGKTGVVRGVTPGMCSLYMSHEERTINVLAEHLMPVNPIRGDKVKVILGDDIEATGYLISIDELEGVVKMDQSQDVKMFPLNYLCKMKNDG